MIDAVGVVVPARDEAALIGACLDSVLAALDNLPPDVRTGVWVVLDRCTDGTARIVSRALADRPRSGFALSDRESPLGTLRHRGSLLARTALGVPGERTWLLHTDADTEVPPDLALRHVRHAGTGAHAVAGVAELPPSLPMHPVVARRYRALVDRDRHGSSHLQVYGANLGVRGDAYRAVGGFGPLSTGEDHDLVARLRTAGYRMVHPTDVRVITSARLRGRATGGVADLLRGLHAG